MLPATAGLVLRAAPDAPSCPTGIRVKAARVVSDTRSLTDAPGGNDSPKDPPEKKEREEEKNPYRSNSGKHFRKYSGARVGRRVLTSTQASTTSPVQISTPSWLVTR